MNIRKDFNSLYKRFIKGVIVKSIIYSLMVSFILTFILSLVLWTNKVYEIWIPIVAFVVLEVGSFVLFYFLLKPNDKKFSKELDSLGLAQRVVTMHEYQDDNSLMARIQRQNAVEHINKVELKTIKFGIPILALIFAIVFMQFSAVTTMAMGLTKAGILPDSSKVINDLIPGSKTYYTVTYDVDGNGVILGELYQYVAKGEDAEPIYAEADDGYVFAGWKIRDGKKSNSTPSTDPFRQDFEISSDLIIIAVFHDIGDDEDPSEPLLGQDPNGDPSEDPNAPKGPNPNGGDGPNSTPNENPSKGAGGEYEPQNQIIDGNTFYGGNTFNQGLQQAVEGTQQNGGISGDQGKTIGDYYGTIAK